jgi:hypothetical protein
MDIPEGTHLFVSYGYEIDTRVPVLSFARNTDDLHSFTPLNKTFTLTFNTSQRYCTGWHDLATGISYPCPRRAELPSNYSECRECQQKTGFNPAFYHSDTVSPQQHARNQHPHILYLAHFGSGIVKVGISWAERGRGRLLDQGARSCLILKTFPNAEQARTYEATIATLSGIAEALQVRAKQQLINKPYDVIQGREELLSARERIETELKLELEDNAPEPLDTHYFTSPLHAGQLIDVQTERKISGRCIGMLGGILIMQQDDTQFMLSLSKLRGHKTNMSTEEEPNKYTPQQASLF